METLSRAQRTGRTVLAALVVMTGLTGATLARRNTAVALQHAEGACAVQLQELRQNTDESFVTAAVRCVSREDSTRRVRPQRSVSDAMVPLARMHTMIPEYHDEQRLPVNAGADLGPQAAIYASPHLDDFKKPWEFEAHGPVGALVAFVFVTRASWTGSMPGAYTDLGLAWGLNCVYLGRAATPSGWQGKVVPAPGGTCRRNGPGTTLEVAANSLGGPADEMYPPVARFSESTLGKPLLGVKCLNAWCEMGRGPFTPLDPLGKTVGLTDPKALVKGWHDEQVLSEARWLSPTSYIFVKTGPRAALIPEPGIEDLNEAAFQTNWQPVATILLESTPTTGKYARWHLKRGPNRLELRWILGSNGRPVWEARIWPSGAPNPERWFFNQRERHFDVGVPATVRFRWTIMDDGIWAPCGMSCCQVEGPPA